MALGPGRSRRLRRLLAGALVVAVAWLAVVAGLHLYHRHLKAVEGTEFELAALNGGPLTVSPLDPPVGSRREAVRAARAALGVRPRPVAADCVRFTDRESLAGGPAGRPCWMVQFRDVFLWVSKQGLKQPWSFFVAVDAGDGRVWGVYSTATIAWWEGFDPRVIDAGFLAHQRALGHRAKTDPQPPRASFAQVVAGLGQSGDSRYLGRADQVIARPFRFTDARLGLRDAAVWQVVMEGVHAPYPGWRPPPGPGTKPDAQRAEELVALADAGDGKLLALETLR